MRILVLILLCLLVVTAFACKKEQDTCAQVAGTCQARCAKGQDVHMTKASCPVEGQVCCFKNTR